MDKPTPPKAWDLQLDDHGTPKVLYTHADLVAHGEAMAAWGAAQYKEDAERLQWMHENICYDGHGYWLPEICINKTLEREPTINDTRAAIDKARG